MAVKSPLRIVVLGAGPSGLCAAWNLVKDGHRVTVIEKEPVCGGQSITFRKGAYWYDLGPHNIHSQRASVINFLKRNFQDDFVQHNFRAKIYFRGKCISYPLTGVDVLKSISPVTAVRCALSFLWSRLTSLFMPKFRDNGSYKTWIVNRFGKKFYDIFFGPYSEKVWKLPADQLSDVVARKRIAVVGIIDLIKSIVFKQERYHPEHPRFVESYYPQSGIGTVCDFFAKGIREEGGEIITEAAVEEVVIQNNSVERVYYSKDGKTNCLDLAQESEGAGYMVLSTIPVNELLMMSRGDVPQAVTTAASGLDFTSDIFLYCNIRREDVFGVPLLYFSEPEFFFNRIYDIGIFSRKMVEPGKTAICVETTCNYNDDLWNMGDDALFEKCIAALERHQLLSRSDVESYHTRRLVHAYPRFRFGYETNLKTIFSFINGVENLISFGRQGLFSYANVDDAIWMGFEVAKYTAYHDRIELPIKELLPTYIDF
jgi:protoporphyrinogen oxidase